MARKKILTLDEKNHLEECRRQELLAIKKAQDRLDAQELERQKEIKLEQQREHLLRKIREATTRVADRLYQKGDTIEGVVEQCNSKARYAMVRIAKDQRAYVHYKQFNALGYRPVKDTIVRITLKHDRDQKPLHVSHLEIIANGKKLRPK